MPAAVGGEVLTKRQREILTMMRDDQHGEDGELVYGRGLGYIGLERVSATHSVRPFAAIRDFW